jgi:quercetin dioxygenase-like cupin family protein
MWLVGWCVTSNHEPPTIEPANQEDVMIISRRDAVASLAVLLDLAVASARAQTPPGAPAPRPPVFRRDLPNVSLDGWEITVNHVDYPPGRVGQPHQHRGFLFAYVLEGSVIAQVIGEGVSNEVRTYTVGEMFYEPIGATHQVSRNASETRPARLLAINLARKEV